MSAQNFVLISYFTQNKSKNFYNPNRVPQDLSPTSIITLISLLVLFHPTYASLGCFHGVGRVPRENKKDFTSFLKSNLLLSHSQSLPHGQTQSQYWGTLSKDVETGRCEILAPLVKSITHSFNIFYYSSFCLPNPILTSLLFY